MVEGMETGAVYRPQTNRHYQRRLLAGIEAGGKPILPTGSRGTGQLVRHLSKGGFIAILLDEKYLDGERLDFLGNPALTSVAAARIALRYDLPINQQVPINIDLPIKRDLTVPINLNVPIKQDITIPIDTGLGVVNIPVKLDTSVPISTSVPIEFDQTVNISTTVPIQLTIPVRLDMNTGQVGGYLDQVYAALLKLRERF